MTANLARIDTGNYHRDAIPTRKHELTGGHWEKRPAGLRVWVKDKPASAPVKPEPPTSWRLLSTTALCHCGCLLRDELETCPACLVWAERDAIRHSWTRIDHYLHTIERQAAA